MHQRNYDFIKDCEQGIETQNSNYSTVEKIAQSPHVLIKIFEQKAWFLVDSGSQICAVSENFYDLISQNNNKILELPVANMIVSTAIGKKRTSIRKKVYLNFEIGEYSNFFVHTIFVNNIILGNN